MSENHESELLEGGSGSAEFSFSEPVLVPIQSSESSDGFTHVEASTNAIHRDDNQVMGSLGNLLCCVRYCAVWLMRKRVNFRNS